MLNQHSKLNIAIVRLLPFVLILLLASCDQTQSPGGLPQSKPSDHGITFEEDTKVPKGYDVAIQVSRGQTAKPGSTVSYPAIIQNQGIETDTYVITTTSTLGWANFSQVPHTVTLQAHSSATFTITVGIPLSATTEIEDDYIVVEGVRGGSGDDVDVYTSVHR